MPPALDLSGLMKVRGCCVFTWREWRQTTSVPAERMVEVGPEHCRACLEELGKLDPPVRLLDREALQKAATQLSISLTVSGTQDLSARRR